MPGRRKASRTAPLPSSDNEEIESQSPKHAESTLRTCHPTAAYYLAVFGNILGHSAASSKTSSTRETRKSSKKSDSGQASSANTVKPSPYNKNTKHNAPNIDVDADSDTDIVYPTQQDTPSSPFQSGAKSGKAPLQVYKDSASKATLKRQDTSRRKPVKIIEPEGSDSSEQSGGSDEDSDSDEGGCQTRGRKKDTGDDQSEESSEEGREENEDGDGLNVKSDAQLEELLSAEAAHLVNSDVAEDESYLYNAATTPDPRLSESPAPSHLFPQSLNRRSYIPSPPPATPSRGASPKLAASNRTKKTHGGHSRPRLDAEPTPRPSRSQSAALNGSQLTSTSSRKRTQNAEEADSSPVRPVKKGKAVSYFILHYSTRSEFHVTMPQTHKSSSSTTNEAGPSKRTLKTTLQSKPRQVVSAPKKVNAKRSDTERPRQNAHASSKRRHRSDEEPQFIENSDSEPEPVSKKAKMSRSLNAESDDGLDDIELVRSSGGKFNLNDQPQRVQTIAQAMITQIEYYLLLKNAFPDGMEKYNRRILIKCAEAQNDKAILKRIKSDSKYAHNVASIAAQRVPIFRGRVKSILRAGVFNLGHSDVEKLDWLLKKDHFMFRFNLDTMIAYGGEPFGDPIYASVLHTAFFDHATSIGYSMLDCLVSSDPSRPDEKEIPAPMLALVATAVFASLQFLRSYIKDFNGNVFVLKYEDAIARLNKIRAESLDKYHMLMHSLFLKATSGRAGLLRGAPLPDDDILDISAMPSSI
ncbi:uncharacterized protein BXZ73DRAFT_83096 [Epithele typhae]|uniref:uncharacterized protein n=1 Tax=Epithele typhae TaxID=378194 RepID=UPI002007A8ED|nr:uncharacterized protein BXZ73DRAFT_83096 [Epithele typhae]KAH9910874.1 hypothetical protein BXZ73DRAFT_83096 [Epithele typhae]